ELAPSPAAAPAIACTVSVGVAAMDDGVGGIDALIKRADQALYAAKRRGRDQVAAWGGAEAP
ncbi:diguanylate cyclase domain-containing protein, partial [Duganella sp. HH101]|uniref:diguanylate cyclase domain-containing protein n=1 Tax=Duganella sp. HH101 TaxID=1781066 RepID=UPI00114CCD4A